MHPTLGNHEKHPKPFSCFIFGLPNHSHNTLGNHEKHPPPFSCFIFNNYSWEPWETPQPLLMLYSLHSETLPTPLLGAMKHPNPFSCFILGLPRPFPPHAWEPWSTQTLFHASFCTFPNPSHPTLGSHEAPKSLFMLHSWPSRTLPTPRLGTMKHPNPFSCFIFCLPKLFPPHSWDARTPFHVSLLAFPSPSHPTLGNHEKHPNPLPIPLLGAMKHPNHFSCFILAFPSPSHPTLGNHEARNPVFMLHSWPSQTLPTPRLGTMKHPDPFSCFILRLPKPFPPHSWEPWTSFWCFRLFPPHSWEPWETPTPLFMFHFQLSETPLTLGNHEKHPNPFSCFIFSLSKLFPPHSWESWEIPTPVFMLHFYGLLLGTVRNTQTLFMLHFWPFQTLPTPLLGAMKHPNPFSCFIFSVSKPFPPHSWEPWSTQPLFHASFLAFPNHSHNTLGNHFEPSQALPTPLLWAMKQPTPVFMLHFWPPQAHPTPRLGTMKHPNFSFGLFLHNGISPGILDKNDKACALSACFLQNGISAGRLDKARSLSVSLAKRHFTRHTWQSTFSFSLSCKTAFHQAYFTQCVLFQLACAKRISLGLLDIEFTTWTLAFVPPFSGFSLFFIVFHMVFVFLHGFAWFFMVFHCFSWFLIVLEILVSYGKLMVIAVYCMFHCGMVWSKHKGKPQKWMV